MRSKLWFLTKMSLNKKIKTKWFLIANILFLIIVAGLINIDSIIKLFGGDFDEPQNIMVIDNANVFDDFKTNYENITKYIDDYIDTDITRYTLTYDEGVEEVTEDKNKVLLVIDTDSENYLKAKAVSKEGVGTVTKTIINNVLTSVRSKVVLNEYNITDEMYQNINKNVTLEVEVISENNVEDNLMVSTIMQVITLPVFMLIMFLIQMIGAEVNEEKTTKSMEIIISNVSPKVHFISKIIAANSFVIIQGLLLIGYVLIGGIIRLVLGQGTIDLAFSGELENLIKNIPIDTIISQVTVLIPVVVIMLLLTFFAYSLLAGILASMTTNLEDFQQLQTPIVIVSLAGYYLSIMSGVFKGSLFIKIASYIPLISSMLSPTLYVMGEITVFDLIISIILLLALIFVLIRYGTRIYKEGILNYSGEGLWKKIFHAARRR